MKDREKERNILRHLFSNIESDLKDLKELHLQDKLNIDEEELVLQINAIEKLLNNPNAMACLEKKECLSLENGLLNLLGEIKDRL